MHVQAIVTKYLGPTDRRGSRIKATATAGSITVSYDSSLNTGLNHAHAAQALAEKFRWSGVWYSGGMPDDAGNVYVNIAHFFQGKMARDIPAFVIKGQDIRYLDI